MIAKTIPSGGSPGSINPDTGASGCSVGVASVVGASGSGSTFAVSGTYFLVAGSYFNVATFLYSSSSLVLAGAFSFVSLSNSSLVFAKVAVFLSSAL